MRIREPKECPYCGVIVEFFAWVLTWGAEVKEYTCTKCKRWFR